MPWYRYSTNEYVYHPNAQSPSLKPLNVGRIMSCVPVRYLAGHNFGRKRFLVGFRWLSFRNNAEFRQISIKSTNSTASPCPNVFCFCFNSLFTVHFRQFDCGMCSLHPWCSEDTPLHALSRGSDFSPLSVVARAGLRIRPCPFRRAFLFVVVSLKTCYTIVYFKFCCFYTVCSSALSSTRLVAGLIGGDAIAYIQ